MLHSGYTEVSIQTQTNTLTNRHVEYFMEQAHNALTLCKLHTHTKLCSKRASCNLASNMNHFHRQWPVSCLNCSGGWDWRWVRIQYLANNAELGSDLWGMALPLQSRLPPFHLSSHPQIVKCSKANHIIQVKSSIPCTNLKYPTSIFAGIHIHIILKVLLKKMIELMLVFSLPCHLAKPQPSCSFSRWWWSIGGWPDAITQCRPWSPHWSLKLPWWWQELLESSRWCGLLVRGNLDIIFCSWTVQNWVTSWKTLN